MIHIVFNRPTQRLKVYDENGFLRYTFTASGDAWGDGASGPYGHCYPVAPGHYLLGEIDRAPADARFPNNSEGFGQIWVNDLDASTLLRLVTAKHAVKNADGTVTCGGIALPIGNLAKHGRAEIMIHGGGSNAPAPLADYQQLCKTEGCTRMYNVEHRQLMSFLSQGEQSNTVVYTVVGDVKPVED